MSMGTPQRIVIADSAYKVKSESTIDDGPWRHDVGTSSGIAGGIYNTRRIRSHSISRTSQDRHLEDGFENEEGDDWRRDDDGKKKQVFRGKTLLW
jgi:hypothetical protein